MSEEKKVDVNVEPKRWDELKQEKTVSYMKVFYMDSNKPKELDIRLFVDRPSISEKIYETGYRCIQQRPGILKKYGPYCISLPTSAKQHDLLVTIIVNFNSLKNETPSNKNKIRSLLKSLGCSDFDISDFLTSKK